MGAFLRHITFYFIILCMVSGLSSFCIINQSCQPYVHAEIWNRRDQGLFPNGFQTDPKNGPKQCCAASSNGCNYPNRNNDEVFFWMDCGTGILQSVVACQKCDIIVTKANTITVQEDDGSVRAVYACLSGSTASGNKPKDELK